MGFNGLSQDQRKHNERLNYFNVLKPNKNQTFRINDQKQDTHEAQNHIENKPNVLKMQYAKKDQNLFSFGFVSILSHIGGKQMQ